MNQKFLRRQQKLPSLLLPALMAATHPNAAAAADQPVSYNADTVVVTGTRMGGKIGDLAGNDAVVSQEQIQFVAPVQAGELLNQVPGVIVERNSGVEHFTAIRSPAFNGGEGAGSFLYLEDGIPMRAAGFAEINGLGEANVEQAGSIEVIRGPGSALYGSNAMHGMLNIIPRNPSKEFESEINTTGGYTAGGRMRGMEQILATTSGTVGNLGLRLSAEEHQDEGWRYDTKLAQQKWVARSVYTGKEDTLTTTIAGQRLDEDASTYVVGTDTYRKNDLAQAPSVAGAYRRGTDFRAATRWQHDVSDTLQLSVTPYTRTVASDFMLWFNPSHAIQKNDHTSGGVQLAAYQTLEGGHSVIFGTDAEYTDGFYSEYQPNLGSTSYKPGWHYSLNVGAGVIAPYVHSEWQVLDHTKATLGARLESTSYNYTNNLSTDNYGLYKRPGSRTDNFLTFTPKFGLVQQWSPDLANYLNLSMGSRAPMVTDLYEMQTQQLFGQVKPEKIKSAEVGTRGNWGSLQFDTSAYWMIKDHYFYRDVSGLNVPFGKTWHRGIELDVRTPLAFGFDLGVAASYSLHTYEFDFKETSATYMTSTVHKNSVMPNAPREQADVRLGYELYKGARAEAEWVLVGPYVTDQANSHSYGGFNLLNLRTTLPLTDQISVQGKITNVANIKYAERATVSTTGVDQYMPGQPLTVYAGVNVKF